VLSMESGSSGDHFRAVQPMDRDRCIAGPNQSARISFTSIP
jgi:hypothetical protein